MSALPTPKGAAPGVTYEMCYAALEAQVALATPIVVGQSPPAPAAAQTAISLAPAPAPGSPISPSQLQSELATLQLVQLQVLGHYQDNSIEIFSESLRQIHRIYSITRFSYADLLLFCGTPARDNVHPGREVVSGRKTMDEVRNAIAILGSQYSLADCAPVGQGIWMADQKITLVNGNEAAYLSGSNLCRVAAPRIGNQTLDLSGVEGWIDFKTLQDYLSLATNSSWCVGVLQEMISLTSKWFWKHPIDSTVSACLIGASWIQTIWPWRPLVAVSGPANSGKSAFIDDLLRRVFNKMTAWIAKPSEAAIRQRVSNKSLILLIDEFESDSKRQAVLDLFRSSSRGAEIYRGTSDQRGKKFTIRHIPWMGNIESGLNDEADRNRFIILDIQRPPRAQHGRLSLPTDDALNDLGARLLAAVLVNAPAAIELFHKLKTANIDNIHGRLIECYAVPAALYTALGGGNETDALACLHSFLQGKNFTRQGVSDEAELIRTILESHFDVGPGRRISVAEAISDETCFEERREALERNGVALVSTVPGPRCYPKGENARLFINPPAVRRYLLKYTDWSAKDIGQLLERITGAEYQQRTIGGKRSYGWSLPAQELVLTPTEKSSDALLKELAEPDPLIDGPMVRDPDI